MSSNMGAKQVKHDRYCWECAGEETALKCSTCIRSFHSECVENQQRKICNGGNWHCPVCIELDAVKGADSKEELDTLPLMINRVFNDKEFEPLKAPYKSVRDHSKLKSMVNLIDLKQIKNNITSYTNFFEFIADLEWIVHNSLIVFPEEHIVIETAKLLKKLLEFDIEGVKKCASCYSNAVKVQKSLSFTIVCANPHLVIWAKVEGWKYWPAKMISFNEEMVNVRFFGDYTRADVQVSKCFLYSETNPSGSGKAITYKMNTYKLALKEADLYIKNLRTKFGSYHVFETHTPFDPSLLNHFPWLILPGICNNENLPPIDIIDSEDENPVDLLEKRMKRYVRLSDSKHGNCVFDDSIPGAPAENSNSANASIALPMQVMTAKQQAMKIHNEQLIDQLEAEKLKYDKMIERKDKERIAAVRQAKRQCEEDYGRRLKANKKMKFCAACDAAEPRSTLDFCNSTCQMRYWMQMNK